jgi:hypothetical protein
MEPVAGSVEPVTSAPPTPPAASAPVNRGPWRCVADPSVETFLRCGRCDKPICPRCMIQTPVGSRCRDCAQLRRLPMFVLRPLDYLKAIGAALGAGIGAAIVLTLIQALVPGAGFLRLFLMAGFGYVVGEAVNRATGNKSGNVLGVIAALGIPIGLIGAQAGFFMVSGVPPLLALEAATAVFLRESFRQLWAILGLAVAAFIAFSRAR